MKHREWGKNLFVNRKGASTVVCWGMAKQDRFTISGRKYLFLSDTPTNAPLTQFPMGSFALDAKYEGE